jgi:hypothetical protein
VWFGRPEFDDRSDVVGRLNDELLCRDVVCGDVIGV